MLQTTRDNNLDASASARLSMRVLIFGVVSSSAPDKVAQLPALQTGLRERPALEDRS